MSTEHPRDWAQTGTVTMQCADESAHGEHEWYEQKLFRRQCPGFVGRAGVPVGSTPVSEEPARCSSKITHQSGAVLQCQDVRGHVGNHVTVTEQWGDDHEEILYRADEAMFNPPKRIGRPVRTQADVDAAYARGISEGRRQAEIQIAYDIRCELVCCDIYDHAHGDEERVEAAEASGHAICFWGEAAARIAETRDDDARESAEQPEGSERAE